MSRDFIYIYEGDVSKPIATAAEAVLKGGAKVRAHGREYAAHTDANLGVRRPFAEACDRAVKLLKTKPLGERIHLDAFMLDAQPRVDRVRFVAIDDQPVAVTPGVEGIDRWAGYLNTTFAGNGTFRYAGICVCKPNSDHRDCAACDHFDTKANMERARDEAITRASYYHTKYVILYQTIYFASDGFRPHAYSGDYHAHVHLSVYGGITGAAC